MSSEQFVCRLQAHADVKRAGTSFHTAIGAQHNRAVSLGGAFGKNLSDPDRDGGSASLFRASATRINKPHYPWRLEITGFQVFDPKAGGLHQVIRFAIEMAAACNTLPDWREPVLPTSYANFRHAAVFSEAKDAPGFEDTANLGKRPGSVVDGAKRESHYHRVDALVVQWQGFA